jgi:hypothetical protein
MEISETERNFQLFKTGLLMISCLAENAIHILELNLKGIQGLFLGLGQWGVIMSICIEYHEKSLAKHKKLICEKGAEIAEMLTLPLIKNMRQLRDLCYKSRNELTLLELQVYKHHIDYLSRIRREHWTQDMLDTHIFVVIQEEMNNILKVLNHGIESSSRNQRLDPSLGTLRN